MMELLSGVIAILLSIFVGSGGEVHDSSTTPPEQPVREVRTYPDEFAARVVRVIDGDTIDVAIEVDDSEVTERVRYIGIDTPEPYEGETPECYSKEASAENRAYVEGQTVRLVRDSERRDTYGRLLRYVYVGDTFVNAKLLESGAARLLFIPPNTREYTYFRSLRDAARSDGRGLWSACT